MGMGTGSWVLVQPARGYYPGGTWPVPHVQILLVGFLLLVIIVGVAHSHWMFPRPQDARPGTVGRGSCAAPSTPASC